MYKRTWLVISVLWAAAFLANGSTRPHGMRDVDFALAAAPFVLSIVLGRVARFVAGSPR